MIVTLSDSFVSTTRIGRDLGRTSMFRRGFSGKGRSSLPSPVVASMSISGQPISLNIS